MVFTIFSALAGILLFAIWSNNNFYAYSQQPYSPSMAALSKLRTDDGGFSAGLSDGETRGFIDAKKGIDNNQCGLEHSNSYCTGYKIGYRLTLRPYL